MIQKYLLSHDEMEKKTQELGENYKSPYFYSIQNAGEILYFLGITHIYSDPNDEQIPRIIKYWKEFLEKTGNNPKVAIIEGKIPQFNGSETQDNCIELASERGLITYLTTKGNIGIINGEPSFEYKIEELLKKFSKEEILYNFFCVAVYTWNKLKNEKHTLKNYVDPLLQKYKETTRWNDVEFSFENMVNFHDRNNTHKFNDKECKKCAYEETHPAMGKLANFATIIRNSSLVENIMKEWNSNKSIFVVYGLGHALVCEPALKKLLI